VVDLPEALDETMQSWDMTFKDTKSSAFVVGQVWGRQKANKYLLDQVRDRMDFPKTITAVKSLSEKWPQARLKLIEDKANGPAVIQSLRNNISGLVPVNPQGDKVSRAHAVTPEVESGNVHLPHPRIAPWVQNFIDEHGKFPNSAYKDQVDTTTQSLSRWLRGVGWARG